jgi:hypothetical protein
MTDDSTALSIREEIPLTTSEVVPRYDDAPFAGGPG